MPKNKISWDKHKTFDLFRAILSLRDTEECRRFFRDLCTLEEVADMTDRWQMVKMIVKDIPYRDIAKKLEVSTTTVARVGNWLRHGTGGYRLVARRLKLI